MNEEEIIAAGPDVLLKRAGVLHKRRAAVGREMRSIVDELRRRASSAGDDKETGAFLQSVDLLPVGEMTHFDVMAMTREHKRNEIPQADSFWHSILVRRRKKQLGVVPEKHLGISKDNDERFAAEAGVAAARTLYRGDLAGLPKDVVPSVVKPVRSSDSRGAFYVFDDGLFSIAQSLPVAGWDEFLRHARQELGDVDFEIAQWELQSLVTREGRPAHDLKFYCFYGEIGAVLETSRHPSQKYAYFDGDLLPIDLRSNKKPSFDDMSETNVGRGFLSSERLDVVRRLSLEIPAPFMRIDFLDSDNSLVFLEFSSAPGQSHALRPEQDRRLGQLYHAAEIRLMNDLLAGKGFDTFREFSR